MNKHKPSANPYKWILRTGWYPVVNWINMNSSDPAIRPSTGTGGVRDFSWRFSTHFMRAITGPSRFVFFNNGANSGYPPIGGTSPAPTQLKVKISNNDGSSAVTLNFPERGQAGYITSSFKNFGCDTLAVSESTTLAWAAGTRYRLDVVHKEVPRTAGVDDWAPFVYNGGTFSKNFQAEADYAAWMTGYDNQDIIASAPGATGGVGGRPNVAMILQNQSGLTRPPKVMWVHDSRMAGTRQGANQERYMNAGGSATADWWGGAVGQAGAAFYMAFRSPFVENLMRYADILVNACDINSLSANSLLSAGYYGAGVTNSDPYINDLKEYARNLGKPIIHYLTYPAGLDTTTITAQVIGVGTYSAETYNRCIDFRNKMLAADPNEIGLVIDAYKWVMRETGNPSLPLVFKDGDVGPAGTPIYGTDCAAVDPETFQFTCSAYTTGKQFQMAAITPTGNWNIPGDSSSSAVYTQKFSDLQSECFGDGRPAPNNAALSPRSVGDVWAGAKLVCYDNGSSGGNCLGDVLTIVKAFPVHGRTHCFSCSEAQNPARTYAGTKWKMVIPSDADNKGAGSFVNGLHCSGPMGAFCDWMNYKTIIKPMLLGMKRAA